MNWAHVQGSWSQAAAHQLAWLNAWWWESMTAPAPRPGDPDRDAEHRWENEGGNLPLTEAPEANRRKYHL